MHKSAQSKTYFQQGMGEEGEKSFFVMEQHERDVKALEWEEMVRLGCLMEEREKQEIMKE